jgi:hypothetical protein
MNSQPIILSGCELQQKKNVHIMDFRAALDRRRKTRYDALSKAADRVDVAPWPGKANSYSCKISRSYFVELGG